MEDILDLGLGPRLTPIFKHLGIDTVEKLLHLHETKGIRKFAIERGIGSGQLLHLRMKISQFYKEKIEIQQKELQVLTEKKAELLETPNP